MDFFALGIHVDAKTGLQQHEDTGRYPSLRQTGHRIRRGALAGDARKATVKLWQAHREMVCGLEYLAEDSDCLRAAAITRKARGADGSIVWPDRTVVI